MTVPKGPPKSTDPTQRNFKDYIWITNTSGVEFELKPLSDYTNKSPVMSVFGRQGDIVGSLGDYNSDLVLNRSTVTGATISDALDTLAIESGKVLTPVAGSGLTSSISGTDITFNVGAGAGILSTANNIAVDFGSGVNQAARGNHTHPYAPLTGGGTSGTWPISITGNAATATSSTNATNATNATNINVAADNSTNATHYLVFVGAATGNQRPNSDTGEEIYQITHLQR